MSIDVREDRKEQKKYQNNQDFLTYMRKYVRLFGTAMLWCSTENLSFTRDTEAPVPSAVRNVGLGTSSAVTARTSRSGAAAARKEQLLLSFLSSHHSNNKLRATALVGTQTGSEALCHVAKGSNQTELWAFIYGNAHGALALSKGRRKHQAPSEEITV